MQYYTNVIDFNKFYSANNKMVDGWFWPDVLIWILIGDFENVSDK